MNHTLLVEIFTEELPPKALHKLGDAFAAGIVQQLTNQAFLEANSVATTYATPRRLAVSITNVRATSPDKQCRDKVLPVAVALDANGQPTAPLLKKLAAMGFADVTIDKLERAVDGKAESFFYSYSAKGISLQVGLQNALDDSLSKLPIPKLMTYQRNGVDVQFARPIHSLVALHGTQIIDVTAKECRAGNTTQGHRFLSSGTIALTDALNYAEQLKNQGHVIASFDERRNQIRAALLAAAGNDQVLMPDALLDEVTALVEWPVIYNCHFEEKFLSVPQECLILTMQTNQKYFALVDPASGKLRPRFLIVSNIETTTPEHIIRGNETVVRPRLSDAKFFFEQDQKKTLIERTQGLANVVYHNKLGNQAQRAERVEQLAAYIADQLDINVTHAKRAALLAKADLLTDMVGEFPELQGIMGSYYANIDDEDAQVAAAMTEQYQPRFAGDQLPASDVGTVLALADKLETLVGIWGIGLHPTGDRDPFALRRHALGVLRMLIEKQLPLSISALLINAAALFVGNPAFNDPREALTTFIFDRLRGILKDQGFSTAEVEAVVAQQPDLLTNIVPRLKAVQAFAALPEADALAAANKRITNILKKSNAAESTQSVKESLLVEPAEQALFAASKTLAIQVQNAYNASDFNGALQLLATIRPQVDAFFNDVMVNADDAALRANRIALLALLHGILNQVADISKLAA